ncbi:MAG: hypothetical protein AAFU50_08865, partial [Pseudomonadota bacterium]
MGRGDQCGDIAGAVFVLGGVLIALLSGLVCLQLIRIGVRIVGFGVIRCGDFGVVCGKFWIILRLGVIRSSNLRVVGIACGVILCGGVVRDIGLRIVRVHIAQLSRVCIGNFGRGLSG